MKVSVITVCYNSEDTIESAIRSVAEQTHGDVEHIVVDGASTDGTMAAIGRHRDRLAKLISEPDDGIYDAMNKGIAVAEGEVVGLLNSDDFYETPEVLAGVVAEFERDPSLDMVLGNVSYARRGAEDRIVRRYDCGWFRPWMLRFGLMPPHPAVFLRRTTYRLAGPYKLGYRIGADFDMLVRLLLIHRCRYRIVNRSLVRMRLGGVSTAGMASVMTSTREMLRSLKENGIYTNVLFVSLRLPVKLLQLVGVKAKCTS